MFRRIGVVGLLISMMWAGWIFLSNRIPLMGSQSPHKIYVAFGFHVNLYHSFRNDTNDEAGFGKDIRIIRKIIRTLDEINNQGIPVAGTWDIENLFSLQETLPKYAPDIISAVKRRVRSGPDEINLVSYNNGLISAMNQREFSDSVRWAISNPKKSGVKDVFGQYAPIIRPQEMMFSPGHGKYYKQHGIEAVSLYYSSITFDAFRIFIPPLSLAEAHNPLIYKSQIPGDEIVIIPTYNIGDLVENGGLEEWVENLRRAQLQGKINNDVLIYINFDADTDFWTGVKVPSFLRWLPNTSGLRKLVSSVQDKDYVEFTTPYRYLKKHPPLGQVYFGQDTADGSFNGYSSWAEKLTSSNSWTHLVRNRRQHAVAQDLIKRHVFKSLRSDLRKKISHNLNESYKKRLRLLSTTSFGMATPFLTHGRRNAVRNLIHDMHSEADSALNNLMRNLNINADQIFLKSTTMEKPSFVRIHQACQRCALENRNGKKTVLKMNPLFKQTNDNSHLFILDEKVTTGIYDLVSQTPSIKNLNPNHAKEKILRNSFISVHFKNDGGVSKVDTLGQTFLKNGFVPSIRYGNQVITGTIESQEIKETSDSAKSVKISGRLRNPNEALKSGHFVYELSLIKGIPLLFVNAKIKFPNTPKKDIFKSHIPALSQKYDKHWQEVEPLQIKPAFSATKEKPFRVIKENYLSIQSTYDIDYFRHSDENLNLSNVNQHITAGYVGFTNQHKGIAIAFDPTQMANFAFSPIKHWHKNNKFYASLNPFGVYFGKQYAQPTWASGLGNSIALLTGEHYASAATTFNGKRIQFSLAIGFFEGGGIPGGLHKLLKSFANPHIIIQTKTKNLLAFKSQAIQKTPPFNIQESDHKKDRIPLSLKLKLFFFGLKDMLD